jgi:hypothetical protein
MVSPYLSLFYQETIMSEKPTYEKLEKRVQEFEQAELDRKRAMASLRESDFLNPLLESEKNLSITLNSIGDAVMATDSHQA